MLRCRFANATQGLLWRSWRTWENKPNNTNITLWYFASYTNLGESCMYGAMNGEKQPLVIDELGEFEK